MEQDGGIDFEDLENRRDDLDLDSSASAAHPETARLLAELDRKTASRKIALPTRDDEVRQRLRDLREPIQLFGERPEDRRERLRTLVGLQRERAMADGDTLMDEDSADSDSGGEGEKEEEFYTEGTDRLKNARRHMAQYSLERAKKRLEKQRAEVSLPLGRLIDVRRAIFSELKTYSNLGSQIGDTRALSSLRFSPDSSMLLTSSWTGTAKLWNVPSCKEIKTIKGHKERVGGVAWHPQATLSQSKSAVNFATSGADNDVKLWSLDSDKPLQTLKGHSARVCRIGFHPSGKYLGSASYDGTWRLWDTETGGDELLLQEGHSKEVYSIAFQEDGALVCTGGLDAIGRVWDLRSGRTAMVLDGHVKDILAIDFSPNGHQIATGSNDDTIRIWDMRSLKSIYTIPAHKSAVSDLKFFRSTASADALLAAPSVPRAFTKLAVFREDSTEAERDLAVKLEGMDVKTELSTNGTTSAGGRTVDFPLSGSFIVSSGYDGYIKIWSADDWQLVKSMTSDAGGKVMSVDVSSDARFLASAEYARTFKLWSSPEVDLS